MGSSTPSNPSPIITVIVQRAESDCGVAALAMILGKTYEEVLVACGHDHPRVLTKGLWATGMSRVAASLGVTLTRKRTFDVETAFGLLCLSDHVVVLKNGLIIDPGDGSVWDADVYLATKDERATLLLVPP